MVMNSTEPFSLEYRNKHLSTKNTRESPRGCSLIEWQKPDWCEDQLNSILVECLDLQVSNVVQNGPSGNMFTLSLDKVKIDGVE